MARLGRRTPPQAAPNALVAAATRIRLDQPKIAQRQAARHEEWHDESWAYVDEVPELKFANLFTGGAFAKLGVYAGVRMPGAPENATPIPVDDERSGIDPDLAASAVAEIDRLRSATGGFSQIAGRWVKNMEAVGDCYLVGYGERPAVGSQPARPEDWEIRSVDEIIVKPTSREGAPVYFVRESEQDTEGTPLDPTRDTAIRLYEQHPRWKNRSDCAMRGLLGEARTLQVLSQQVMAQAMRAASAGFLCVPNELSFGAPKPTDPAGGTEAGQDLLNDVLEQVLVGPVQDPANPASVQPGVIRGESKYLHPDFLRRLTLHDPAEDVALEARIEGRIKRLARGVNLPVEVLMGHQQTTFCVDDWTEALTPDGWRHRWEIHPGDLVLTIDHSTGVSSWQPVLSLNAFDVEDEPMLSIDRKAHSSLTTANHRWPVLIAQGSGTRTFRNSAALNTNHRIPTAAPCADVPEEAKWSDDLVELVAWFYTEGSVDRRGWRRGGQAVITQSEKVNPEKVSRIRLALTRLVGPAVPNLRKMEHVKAWREYHDPNSSNVRFFLSRGLTAELETVAPDRIVHNWFIRSLTRSQLELFLHVSKIADGWTVNTGTVMFAQNDPRRVDAYELAVILSGRTPSRWSTRVGGNGPYAGVRMHLCSMSERTQVQPICTNSKRGLNGGISEWVRYTGTVWCPTTQNGTWMARRDGHVFFTGNSNASQVDEDTFEDFLEPRCRLFVDQLTYGYLRPNLADVYPDRADQIARIVVWYDPSAVVERPNLEGNATEAHKDFVISDAARRRYQGFTEDDAPDAEEVLIRSALHQTRFGPELVSALLQILADEAGIELPSPAELAQTPAADGGAARSRGLPDVLARVLSLPASAAVQKPTPRPVTASRRTDPGRDLMEIDRELRTRLLVASNDAMNRALERAGNRLRSQAVNHRALLRDVPAYRVAATLAGAGVLTATSTDEALEGAWDNLHADWLAWAAGAQAAALAVSGRLVTSMTAADRIALAARQADDLASGWEWFRAQIQQLATDRMFDPDPALPVLGEFDPSLKVPVGLVRQAIARAGGASGLITDEGGGAWVALTDAGTRPAGGIGTGDLIAGVLRDGGVGTEGYVWQYGPAFRSTPFEPHERLDGTQFVNFDDPSLANFGAWPPLGFYMPGDHAGCVAAGTVVEAPGLSAATLRWFEGEMVELATAGGEHLTITPNHPVLTQRGWVPAGLLAEGDDLIRCLDPHGATGLVPHDDERPARVEELLAACWVSPGVVACGVPVTAEDFDGDGQDGQVCAVLADRHLVAGREAPFLQPYAHLRLGRATRLAASLAGASRPFQGVETVGDATLRLVGGGGHLTTLLRSASRGEPRLDLPVARWRNPGPSQTEVDRVPVHAEMLGHSVDGLAAFAQADKLVHVDRLRRFSGHVFNLHTRMNWYTASRLVVHNCNCDFVPTLVVPASEAAA